MVTFLDDHFAWGDLLQWSTFEIELLRSCFCCHTWTTWTKFWLNVVEDIKVLAPRKCHKNEAAKSIFWNIRNSQLFGLYPIFSFCWGAANLPPLQSTFGETSDLHLLASAHPPVESYRKSGSPSWRFWWFCWSHVQKIGRKIGKKSFFHAQNMIQFQNNYHEKTSL